MKMDQVASFVASLRACSRSKDLPRAHSVHVSILGRGLLEYCSDDLITMYAKCGALAKAKELFDMYESTDVFTWTALIAGYTQKGQGQNALSHYERMQQAGLSPDAVTYACVLKACGSIRVIHKGEEIHDDIAKRGLLKDNVVLGTALVDMYAKCGALVKARKLLEELPTRNMATWNALIAGYAENSQGDQALKLYECMQHEGHSPNAVTYSCVLKACGSIGAIDQGERIHDEIKKKVRGNDVVLSTALIDMYAKCGALEKARQVLEEFPFRNVISWNALIAGYVEHGKGHEALECFEQMQREGLFPDGVTLVCTLNACGSIKALGKGEKIRYKITTQGWLGKKIVLGSALVNMYVECGALAKAYEVLKELPVRDVSAWTALMAGYTEHDEGEQALECFTHMQHEGLIPDAVTFICILQSCASIKAAEKGEKIHDQIVKQGLLQDNIPLGTALVDMYAKFGALVKARQVLEELPARNIVCWNALIAGYANHDESAQALIGFEHMQQEGLAPDAVTFACILKACAGLGAADTGEMIHYEIGKQGLLESDIVLSTALIDMYAKCGALGKAQKVLEELPVQCVIPWIALVTGYVQQCKGARALNCFEQMQREGLSLDADTLTCVLSACSRLGLEEDAHKYFLSMSREFGLKLDLEHYTSMVELLGRAGRLDMASEVVQKMSSCTDVVWFVLLAACRKWGALEVGRWAFEHSLQVDQKLCSGANPYSQYLHDG